MLILFFVELWAFLATTTDTSVILDTNSDTLLRINFNITMMDLACDFVSVDVYDVLGTNTQNMTKNIEKWQLDDNGVKRIFQGRNKEVKEISHDEHHPDIETLHKNGVHAIAIGEDGSFEDFLESHKFSFVNFYAPWCIWCQRLEPTWEAFAERLESLEGTDQELQVDVAKVDCVANRNLCATQRVMAFPTLRLFKDSEPFSADYKNDRTVVALEAFVKTKLAMEEKMKDWHPKRVEKVVAVNKDHPGCMVSGHLLVNRVPGNFHIEAKSKSHNLDASMTNLSHAVNHLSFGFPLTKDHKRRMAKFSEFATVNPLDDMVYVTKDFHQAHHHFSKVISTHYQIPSVMSRIKKIMGYQMLTQSQIMQYEIMDVPEAKFSYDLSPMAVVVAIKGRRWYDFITSLCAIIGGTFTVVGLLDSFLHKIVKSDKGL